MDKSSAIKLRKRKDGKIELINHIGVVLATLTQEQARSLADVLLAATK